MENGASWLPKYIQNISGVSFGVKLNELTRNMRQLATTWNYDIVAIEFGFFSHALVSLVSHYLHTVKLMRLITQQ